MDRRKKGEYIGVLGTLLVHVAVIALLILVSFAVPQPDEDAGGVPVMMGDVESARGFDDPSLVDVDVLDENAATPAETEPELPSEQGLLTQTEEETVTLKPKTEEPKKETVKPKEVTKPKEPVKKPEKTEAEKNAEREQKSKEIADKNVFGAFNKGAQMEGNKGTAVNGTGTEGNKDGDSSTGQKSGTGDYGDFDLGGRGLGKGTLLPKPVYKEKDEGQVVVEITVNPAGQVVATKIARGTTTVNPVLRKAAEDAAKKTRFEAVDKVTNQTGTITYYFKLR